MSESKRQDKAYEHQRDAWENARDKELLSHSTGTGKTLTLIGLCIQRVDSAIIMVPLSVLNKWKDEIDFWCDNLQIKEEHDRYKHLVAEGTEFFIVTKEYFRDNVTDMPQMEAFVSDEAHHISGMKSNMSKAALKYVKEYEIDYRWLATGTPFRSSPWGVYRLAQLLDYDWHYKKFERKYFSPSYFGQRRVMTPKDDIKDDMAKLVNKIGHVVDIEDIMDMPDQVHTVEKIDLNKEQEKARREVLKNNLEIIVRYTKLHQIENAILSGDEYNDDKTFRDNKLSRIQEYIESTKKIAIACRYTLQLEHLKNNINTDKNVYAIHGGDRKREETVNNIQEDDEAVVLISAGVSEGYELPDVSTVVFASMDYAFTAWKQLIGRTMRMNNPSKNLYVYLLSVYNDSDEQSVDEGVYENVVEEKNDFHLKIFGKNKEADN